MSCSCPRKLVEQWQDELGEKFSLEFDILTRDMIEGSRSGNPFNDRNFLIARLDVLARNEELQEKLERSNEWDVVILMKHTDVGQRFRRGSIIHQAL